MKVITKNPVDLALYADFVAPSFEIENSVFVGNEDSPSVVAVTNLKDMIDGMIDSYLIVGITKPTMKKENYDMLYRLIFELEDVKDHLCTSLNEVKVK